MHHRNVALFDALATALGADDVERALDGALREITGALDLAAGWIWLLDPETERFYLAAAHDLPPYLREPVRMTGEECWCMEAFLDGGADAKDVDVIACSRLRCAPLGAGDGGTRGLRSHASVALRFGERRLGILNVCPRTSHALDEDDVRLLSAAGAQIGLAVERGRLAEAAASRARTDERARLAREIHDTLAQEFTAIALQLESALRDVPPTSQTSARIALALGVARMSVARARGSVLTLRADPLEGRPLATALAALARRLTSETGIRVTLHERGVTELPYEAEGELYRIASEALANARTHADASRIEIELAADGDRVVLRVRDDGRGFYRGASTDERYGLRGMEERARLAGGMLCVVTSPAAGALIEVVVPRTPA